MPGIAHTKGLADIRTTVSTHARSASRHKGTPYLEILSLGMERLRLQKELEWMGRRQERVRRRLQEIGGVMEGKLDQVREEDPPDSPGPGADGPQQPTQASWRTTAFEY